MRRGVCVLLVLCVICSAVPAAMAQSTPGKTVQGTALICPGTAARACSEAPAFTDNLDTISKTLSTEIGTDRFDQNRAGFDQYRSLRPPLLKASRAASAGLEYSYDAGKHEATVTGYTGTDVDVTIPDTVESGGNTYTVVAIGEEVFDTNAQLTSVIIPDTVTTIGYRAFYQCSNLLTAKLPPNLNSIGDYAFYLCRSLTTAEIPDTIKSLGKEAFGACYAITSVKIPSGVASIGDGVFRACRALTSAEIAYGVTRISSDMFDNCPLLTSINLPDSVTSIGAAAFRDCTGLTSFKIPSGANISGTSVFQRCTSLESIEIPDSVTYLGQDMFRGCTALKSVQIPGSVPTIDYDAFRDCTSLATVEISAGVKTISRRAFYGCTSLASVKVPDTVTKIDTLAFSGCTHLESVTVPDIAITTDAFQDCTKLEAIVFRGSRNSWETNNANVEMPDTALVWCTGDNTVVGTISKITLTGIPASGSNVPVDGSVLLNVRFSGIIPDECTLPVSVSLVGLEHDSDSGPLTVTLTPSQTATDVLCTLTGAAGDSLRAAVTRAAGQEYDAETYGAVWTGTASNPAPPSVEPAPSITISSDASGSVSAGETVNITVTGENIPSSGVSGTLSMIGMSPTDTRRAVTTDFTLTRVSPSKTISCLVDSGATAAEAWISDLQAGEESLPLPSTHIILEVAYGSTATPTDAPPGTASPVPSPAPSAVPDGSGSPTASATALPTASQTGHVSPTASQTGHVSPTASQSGHVLPTASQSGSGATGDGQSPGAQNPGTSSTGLSTPPLIIAPPAATPPSHASAAPGTSSETPNGTGHTPVSTAAQQHPIELLPELPAGAPSSLEVIPNADTSTGSALVGADIGSLWDGTTAESLMSWVEDPEAGSTVRVITSEGEPVLPEEQIATGMIVEVRSAEGELLQETTIIVKGDVTGSGEIDLTQLVRMAKAVVGTDPLEGPYALAGDLNKDNETSLTDLVQLAKMYKDGSLTVDYAVTDSANSELLEEAGYELEAWTDDMTVMRAGIPENAEIDSIAWTQHDIFEDGREQKLYYEGLEEDIVFGTYDEGQTIITTEVTTKAGKVGTRQTTIDWSSVQATDDSVVDAPDEAGVGRIAAAADVVSRAGTRPVATRPRPTTKPSASPSTSTTNAPSRPTARPSAAASQSSAPSATASGTPAPSYQLPTTSMLFAFRAQALSANNELRNAMKIRPLLRRSNDLSKAAMVRAEEMAAAGVLQHERPDGSKYDTVVTLGEGTVVGENIHFNKGYPTADIAMIAEKGWENSAPHRKQMLEPRYLYTGLGFAQAPDGAWYCVQLFSNGDNVLSIDTPKT